MGTILDETANNHDGAYNGALYQQPGMVGYSLGFDGINDYIRVPSSADFQFGKEPLTLFLYFKYNVVGNVKLLAHDDSNTPYLASFDDSSGVYFSTAGGSVQSARINDTDWHTIAITRDGTVLTAYTDTIAGTPTAIHIDTEINFTGDIIIGAGWELSLYFENVRIDEFMVWKGVALTQAEIATYSDWNYTY